MTFLGSGRGRFCQVVPYYRVRSANRMIVDLGHSTAGTVTEGSAETTVAAGKTTLVQRKVAPRPLQRKTANVQRSTEGVTPTAPAAAHDDPFAVHLDVQR